MEMKATTHSERSLRRIFGRHYAHVHQSLELDPTSSVLHTLIYAPKLGRVLHDPVTFFDRACIFQSDEELNQDFFYSIGGFPANSDEFLVRLSPKFSSQVLVLV